MSEGKTFVLPTKIPWDSLKGKELEECVYWLLHGMGARDLQWRVGGTGQGAPDNGRDLEATFYSSDPDGEIHQQRWWIEAKGRAGTVEKEAVMSAAHSASATTKVDILVIVTNTQFSNPTLDWVNSWNTQGNKPKTRLWDRSTLERHLINRPEVVARFFSNALSTQGRLEFVRSQFWNQLQLAEGTLLKLFWKERKQLEWDSQALIAVILSEVANGSIGDRAWASTLTNEDLQDTFASVLINGPSILLRSHRTGNDMRGYTETLTYLLLTMLVRFKADSVADYIQTVWDGTDAESLPEDVRDAFVAPMINRLETEVFDICQSDCFRVSTEPKLLNEKQIENYWDRLKVQDSKSEEEDKPIFFMEAFKIPCKVGFKSSQKHGCPFLKDQKNIKIRLSKLQATIFYRLKQKKEREDNPLRKYLR